MAVVLDSISPENTAGNIAPNAPVVIELSDATDMTLALVEVLLGSVSHTVANGKLDYWSVRALSGGVYVDDLTSVTFATVPDWFSSSGEEISVTVKYNSVTISTTIFTVVDHAPQIAGGLASFNVLEASALPTSSLAYYYIVNRGTDRSVAMASYYVLDRMTTNGGAHYYVAFPVRASMPASVVVGNPVSDVVPASAIVQAMTGQTAKSSVVVQGYFRQGMPSSVITGIVFRHGETSSAIVGIETVSKLPASVVVYGVIRGSVLEVSVIDDTTKTALEALGVAFS